MVKANSSLKKVNWKKRLRHRSKSLFFLEQNKSSELLHESDCGPPVVVRPTPYISETRGSDWGAYLDGFLEINRFAFSSLDVVPNIISSRLGVRLELKPGLRSGAIPLRSAVTGKVAGGLVIRPRFGWPGIGHVLSATGWGSGPEFLELPYVPGSGREVPPWVIAGPVLNRIANLLADLKPGFREKIEIRSTPRGQIQWKSYLNHQFPSGNWHSLPCKYSELDTDTRLRQAIRWTLERLHSDLSACGGNDAIAIMLIECAVRLIERVHDVPARRPSRGELENDSLHGPFMTMILREGLRAMGWIVDERGLGGGRSSDGLAWSLPLERLWERFVEFIIKDEIKKKGGRLRVGNRGETTVPLIWNDSIHKPLGHLVPDFIVTRNDEVEIIDAKYKSHFADLDIVRWSSLLKETQDSMRADIHQVLAYAAVVGSCDNVLARLIYPVNQALYEDLSNRNRLSSESVILVGKRVVRLCIQAACFGYTRKSRLDAQTSY